MIVPGHDPIWDEVFPGGIPEEARQPASIDLRIGNTVIFPGFGFGTVECIMPGQFLLASTQERVYIPPAYAGRLMGKSSLARLGLIVENAGWVDPGFEGVLTLELANISPTAIKLAPGQWIAQIALETMLYRVADEHLYRGKYQHASGPEEAK